MLSLWWTLLGISAVVVALRVLGSTGLERALKQVRMTGEVGAVIVAVEGAAESKQATMWDQAIGALWREYRRPEAIQLMIAGARRSEAPILQYWLKNAMDVEPELAAEHFTEEFLEEHFRPMVAASCGRAGCCG